MKFRKRYKYGIVLLAVLCINIGLIIFNLPFGISLIVLEFLALISLIVFLVLNILVKHTNWYRNLFAYTSQMCTNLGYRDYLVRNLDIVNVGSNPARFAFHYEDVLGENWSTGNQGLDMDFEILKYRHSFIKKGGVVLLPLVAFSGVSGYLRNKPQYTGTRYYAKFAKTLDPMQASLIPEVNKANKMVRFPLLVEPKAIKYLILDEQPDNRLMIDSMSLMYPQLLEDARHMMESWLEEFGMKSIDMPLSEDLKKGIDISVRTIRDMIDFLVERKLKPVIILTPMSEPLQSLFTEDVKKKLIYDFIEKINRPDVQFLDYSNDKDLQNPELYFNCLFMNLHGRKLFTKRVLNDLGIKNKINKAM